MASRPRTGGPQPRTVARGVMALALLAVPLVVAGRPVSVLTLAGLNALLAISLGSLMRYTGQLSLAHGSFAAVAAYTVAIATVDHDVPFLLASVGGVALAGVAGYVLARPLLRLSGFYLIIVTLGAAEVFTVLLRTSLRSWTHGVDGIAGIPRPGVLGVSLLPGRGYYWLVWLLVFATVALVEWFGQRTRAGLMLRASALDEVGTRVLGLSVAPQKALVFAASTGLAGLAGILMASLSRVVSPESFGLDLSITVFTMIIIGGWTHSTGPVVAAIALTYLPEVAPVFLDFRTAAEGLLIVVVLMLRPEGLITHRSPLFQYGPRPLQDRSMASASAVEPASPDGSPAGQVRS